MWYVAHFETVYYSALWDHIICLSAPCLALVEDVLINIEKFSCASGFFAAYFISQGKICGLLAKNKSLSLFLPIIITSLFWKEDIIRDILSQISLIQHIQNIWTHKKKTTKISPNHGVFIKYSLISKQRATFFMKMFPFSISEKFIIIIAPTPT